MKFNGPDDQQPAAVCSIQIVHQRFAIPKQVLITSALKITLKNWLKEKGVKPMRLVLWCVLYRNSETE